MEREGGGGFQFFQTYSKMVAQKSQKLQNEPLLQYN